MTNLSELTRREQVLKRLQDACGTWVDGADLSNAECGGSEGLKRLRELRQPQFGGHDIKMRQKMGSDQRQYRIPVGVAQQVERPVESREAVGSTPTPDTTTEINTIPRDPFSGHVLMPIDIARHEFEPFGGSDWTSCDRCNKRPYAQDAHFQPILKDGAFLAATTEEVLAPPVPKPPEPAEVYDYRLAPEPEPERKPAHLGRTADGTYVFVNDNPPPTVDEQPPQAAGQTDLGVPVAAWGKFKTMPTIIDMGTMRLCPTCKGYRKPIHETGEKGEILKYPTGAKGAMKPRVIAYEDFCRDPRKGHHDEPCERCNGFGLVPA